MIRIVSATFTCLLAMTTTVSGATQSQPGIVGVWNGDSMYCTGMEADGIQPVRSAVLATFHADSTVSFSFSGVFQALPGQDEGAMGSDSHGMWRQTGTNTWEILHTDMTYKKDMTVPGFPASPASRDRNTATFTLNPDGSASWEGVSEFHNPFDLDYSGKPEGSCSYNGSFKRLAW